MTDLDSLIQRLEKAEGPSRELDAAIFVGVHEGYRLGKNSLGGSIVLFDGFSWQLDETVPDYSSSIDAALTLVPDGWAFYRLDQYHDKINPAWGWGAHLRCYSRPDAGRAIGETRHGMALALVIAALRARSLKDKE